MMDAWASISKSSSRRRQKQRKLRERGLFFFFVEEEGRSVGVLMCALCSHVQERHMFSSSSRGFSLYRLLSFVQETKSQK